MTYRSPVYSEDLPKEEIFPGKRKKNTSKSHMSKTRTKLIKVLFHNNTWQMVVIFVKRIYKGQFEFCFLLHENIWHVDNSFKTHSDRTLHFFFLFCNEFLKCEQTYETLCITISLKVSFSNTIRYGGKVQHKANGCKCLLYK